MLIAIVDAAGTVLMWLFEDDVARSAIHNLWDAFFFSTVQLLTVSSQMPNPVTTGGRIVDIVLELTALCLVSGSRRLRLVLPQPRRRRAAVVRLPEPQSRLTPDTIRGTEPLYKPEGVEERLAAHLEEEGLYRAGAEKRSRRDVRHLGAAAVLTGALHMGHAWTARSRTC